MSYFLQSFSFVDFGNKVYAANNMEDQIDYTNIVAILVDNSIYNSLQDEIEWYSQTYIQWSTSAYQWSGSSSSIFLWTRNRLKSRMNNFFWIWWNDGENEPLGIPRINVNNSTTVENTNYIKYNSISNSRAIVLPIDTDNLTAPEITQILENLYFDGIQWESSKLVWVILIWDIPLPVVNQFGYVYPTIYPYVDFEDQKFVWDANSQYFVYNNNPKWQAELRHGWIKFDTIAEYQQYFGKLKDYAENPSAFIWKNIWYDDFVWNRTYFFEDWLNAYINNFLFAEDLWYKRFSDLMIAIMQWEHNEAVSNVLQEMWEVLSGSNYTWNYASGMEVFLATPELSTPTMTIRKILYEWYISSYTSLLGVKFMDKIRENISTANRRVEHYTWTNSWQKARDAMDTHYIKIEQKDETLLRNNWWLDPLLISINNVLEEFVDEKVESEKYRLNEVIPLTYLDYSWALYLWNCTWQVYDAFENYFFGKQAKYMDSMQDVSSYRWTYRNYAWISGLTINDIQNSQQPSTDLDIDLNKKSVWWSYEIFAQQVDANRWYNTNNTITELDLYNQNKTAAQDQWSLKCEKKFLWICWKKRKRHYTTHKDSDWNEVFIPETPQWYSLRNRWWASPLNLDSDFGWTSGYNFQDSVISVYDIGGSKALISAENEANSYLWVDKYTRLIQRKFVVKAYRKDWKTLRKKFFFKNKSRLDADVNGKWYNSSMWEDVLFTNYLPSYKTDDWEDIGQDDTGFNRVYTGPKLSNSVDYFTIYKSNGINVKERQSNIIKLARKNSGQCKWHWQVYTYKTLDSRVKNSATNTEDVWWKTYRAFKDEESPIYQLYQSLSEELTNLETELANSPTSNNSDGSSIIGNLNTIKDIVTNANTKINDIINTSAATISGWTDEHIISYANDLADAYDNNTWESINSIVLDLEVSLQEVESFFEFFSFESLSDYLSNKSTEFRINGKELIFYTPWKTNLINRSNSVYNDFSSQAANLKTWRNNAKSIYNSIENTLNSDNSVFKNDSKINSIKSDLNNKYDSINNLPWWCSSSRYSKLCLAILSVRNNLDNSGRDVADRIKWKKATSESNRVDWISVFYITQYKKNWSVKTGDYEPFKDIETNNVDISEATETHTLLGDLLNQIPTTSNSWYEIQVEWMNITTSDRPIDSPKYMTFKWIGGDKVTFIYPDLYKVEVYTWDNEKLTLLSPEEIANNIRNYLRAVVRKYNSYLTGQQAKAPAYYNQNKNAYDLLDDLDKLASPNYVWDNNRPYQLFDEDYLINLLVDKMNNNAFFTGNMWWYEPIEFLAHMMYYQNIERPERLVWETIQDDMDNIRESFDINQKIAHIYDNYIVSNHNSGSFITPWYRDDGYEVAYINSDENDYIVYEVTSPFMESIKSSVSDYKKPTASDIEKSQLEEELVNECNIPEDGEWVLLFDLKTMTSPWLKAIKCRREKLREKPLEFSLSISLWSSAFGAGFGAYWADIAYTWRNWDTLVNDVSSISDTVMTQLWANTDTNKDLLNSISGPEYERLSKIDKYVKFTTPLTSISADDAKATVKISSAIDLGNVYIHAINIWDTKVRLSDDTNILSQNITQWTTAFSTWNISLNPFDSKVVNLNFVTPKGWSNVVVFYVCPSSNTSIDRCIKKTLTLYIVPGSIKDISIETVWDTVMQWSQMPIRVLGVDEFGNNVWQLFTERFTISTSAGTLVHVSSEKPTITFSNFNESNFILNASGVNPWQLTLTVSGPIWDTTIQKTKSINVVKWKLNVSFWGLNTAVGSNSNGINNNYTYSATYNSSAMSSNSMSMNNSSLWGTTYSASNTNTAPSMGMNSSSLSASSANNSSVTNSSISQSSSVNSTPQNTVLSPNNMNINITLPDENIYSYKDEFGITQADTNAIPKLSLRLSSTNGSTLSNINTIASVTSKRSLVKIWRITEKTINKNMPSGTVPLPQYKFAQSSKFDVKSGVVDVYLLPNFKAWNDTIYISIPWIDPVEININVLPATAKVVNIKTNSDNIKIWESVDGNIQIYDWRNNLVKKNVTLRVWITGPFSISWFNSDSQLINVNGWTKKITINSANRWWMWYIYAMIDGTWLSNQQAWYKKLTVQDTILPKENLNIMYLNIFGSDRWNQRWYLSDNNDYIQYLITHSEKLLAATTQLVTPNKLKEFHVAIDQSLNVSNLADEDIYFKLDDNIHIWINNVWTFGIPSSSFVLRSLAVSESNQAIALQSLINDAPSNKNLLVYIPDITDSIITSNELTWNKIKINWESVFDFNNWFQNNQLEILLSDEYLSGYQIWDASFDGTHIWNFVFVQNTGYDIYINIENLAYDYSSLRVQWSTNRPWIWIYEIDSTFDDSTLGYPSIQDSLDPEAWIWFTAEFKNVTNFGAWQPIWEATVPYSSEFLINIWDPLLKRVDDNETAKVFDGSGTVIEDTKFDKWLGELIYSDPTKTIYKVINIDFNNDNLEDILVIYSDWNVKLLKNYGWTNPFRDMWPLMVLADRIKDVVTWDVDGNGYDDLIIWTQSNVLRVYHNYDWIFEVDGYPICININVHKWEISQNPSRVEWLLQIYFEDMDNDGSMDIITNDKLWFIKIFYGGKNNSFHQENYVSTNQYMCDENRYLRLSNGATAITQSNHLKWKLFNNNHSGLDVDVYELPNNWSGSSNTQSSTSNTTSQSANVGNNTRTATSQWQQSNNDTTEQEISVSNMTSSNENIVHRFAAKINPTVEVLDNSYFRRAWINPDEEIDVNPEDLGINTSVFEPQDTGGIEKMKLSQIKQKFNIQWKLEQATNFDIGAAINIYSQSNRYKVAGFGIIPLYESGVIDENQIQYVPIWWLTNSDPVKVYKKYKDVNGDVLEDGDKVEVTVTIQARSNVTWTFIDNIVWPWIIPVDEELDMIENFWFESGTVTPDQVNNVMKIHRNLDNARYMIDNIWMKSGDIIKIHYRLYYEWTDIMNISLKDLDGTNYKQYGWWYMTNHPKDGFLDIKTQPTDGCNPSMYAFFNQWSGSNRGYQLEYIDLWGVLNNISSSNQQNYEDTVSDLTSSMTNAVTDDGKTNMDSVPGMSSVLESSLITDMFSETFSLEGIIQNNGIDLSNILNIPNQMIDALLWDITDQIMSFVNSSCGAFSLKSLLGINSCNTYIPFNESFLWAWDYHIFGCFNIPPLTQLIGKGMPLLNIPGNRWPTPYGYIPAPGLFGYPWKWATDSFSLWNDGWTYPSFFRLYVMPTLTAEIWFALCFGPYATTLALPDPMGSVWGNCVVFTVPIPCGKKSTDDEAPDETLPSDTLEEYADMPVCNQTTNTPTFSQNQSNSCIQLAASSDGSDMNIASPETNWNWSVNPSYNNGSYLWWFINIDKQPNTVIWYDGDSSPISIEIDGVELVWWASEKNKILWSAAKWLIEKVVKSRLDKQIKYTMNNLTNFYIWITWPDLSILTEWWDSLWENFKNAVNDQYGSKADREECKKQNGSFINGQCITEQQKCINKWKQWRNWSCVEKTNQSANDQWLDSLSNLLESNWVSREQISNASESNFANPLAFLEKAFEDVPLINISTEDVVVNVPMITSDDIISYIATSQNWLTRQQQILEEWKNLIYGILWICGWRKVDDISDLKDAVNELKQQLTEDVKNSINWLQDEIKWLKEQIKATSNGEEKARLQSELDQKQSQLNELIPYQNQLNAQDKLNQKYDLAPLGDYAVREREDGNFLIELSNYPVTLEIISEPIYLLFDVSKNEIKPFTQWIKLNTTKKGNKIVIDSIESNGKKISNWDLKLRKITSKSPANQCASIFIGGSFDVAIDSFVSIEANANNLIQSVKQNIETLELYKKFPSELYNWVHVSDIYLWEISSFLNSFLGTLSMWMNTNATRYSQYVNAIINIMSTIETYQAIIDLAANFNKRCSTCSNDNYDQFTCKLGLICPDGLLPTIPIPPMKIPSIYIDLSNLNLGTNIKLPKFNFKTVSVELPKLPDLPTPPKINLDIDSFGEVWISNILDSLNLGDITINGNLSWIPLIPSPPKLPDLPALDIEADISLPLLPPAPKIPALPNEINIVINAADKIWQILCLVKRLPLVNETSVKAKIEQLSQRTYEVPYRDTMDQTFASRWDKISSSMSNSILKEFMPFLSSSEFKDVELKWFDISLESYINLQLNFDEFYDVVNDMVDQVNSFTSIPTEFIDNVNENMSQWMNNVSRDLQKCIDDPLWYEECLELLWSQWQDLVDRFLNIKDRLSTMKDYIKNWFKDITIYKQELVNLENKIDYIWESMNETENNINELDEKIAITQAQIQHETSELKKAQLLANISVYNNNKNKLSQTLQWLENDLETQQSKYEVLSNKYWPDIKKYDTAMNTYNALYEQYQALEEELNSAKELIVDSLAAGENAFSSGVNSAFDKLWELSDSIQWNTNTFEQNQQIKRGQRYENLQNLYKETEPLSYEQYDEKIIDDNKKLLASALSQIKEKSEDAILNKKVDGYINLLDSDANIYPATDSINTLQKEYSSILNKYREETDNIWEMINNDYNKFLYAVANNDKKLVSNDDIQITLSENLFKIDNSVKNRLSNSENVYKMYLDYYNKNIDGYINAMENNSAKDLNMSDNVYKLNKKYLYNIKEKTELAYDRIETDETSANKQNVLLAQYVGGNGWSSNTNNSNSNTSNYVNLSTYFQWQIISTPEWWFMLANSNFTKEFENQSIMVDINKDWDNDLILRDDHEIYIKYRNNNTSFDNSEYSNKYYVYNISSYDDLMNNSNNCIVKINNMNVKLCDENREVKNFKYAWSDFDSISISRTNSAKLWDDAVWYLVKLIHRVDLFDDKEQIVNNSNRDTFDKKYIIVLPKWSQVEDMEIKLEDGRLVDVESDEIFNIQYFNELSDTINLAIWEIPRNWQYAEVYTLDLNEWRYTINSSTSNQIVWWPQIIADNIWPEADIELYRPATDTVVDDWEVFDWYVSTRYTLRSHRKDNALLDSIWITDEDGVILDRQDNIFQKTGYIELKNLFFTDVWVHHYYFVGNDINGNATSVDVTLTIKTPKIDITDISRHSTNTEISSNIPVSITAEIDQDLDEWIVQFLRKRNNIWELMTWVMWWIKSDKYNLVPNQTIVTWAYFDFGDSIWLYLSNWDLAAKVVPENGQIVIEHGYENKVSIEVDYANHIPLIKILENKTTVLMLLQLTSENLVDIDVYENLVVKDLEWNQFGTFNWWKAIIENNEVLLYISPKWDIYTDHYLYGDYSFDVNDGSVIYTFKKSKKWPTLWKIKVKVKNIL